MDTPEGFDNTARGLAVHRGNKNDLVSPTPEGLHKLTHDGLCNPSGVETGVRQRIWSRGVPRDPRAVLSNPSGVNPGKAASLLAVRRVSPLRGSRGGCRTHSSVYSFSSVGFSFFRDWHPRAEFQSRSTGGRSCAVHRRGGLLGLCRT